MTGLSSVTMRLFKPKSARTRGFRIYYASDVHGSGVCWRKFLRAASFYEVDALIMGGDLTGKLLAPVVRDGDGWTARLLGEQQIVRTEEELAELVKALGMNGFYPWLTSPEDLERFRADVAYRDETFERAMVDELAAWMRLADERLGPVDKRAYVIPGNDDPWCIDPVLTQAESVVACDGQIARLGDHEMLSLAWANRTPWDSPRELDEDDLYARLKALADELESPASAIFNIHPPPFDSELDIAAELDDTLRPIVRGGQPHMVPVGSTAVRQIIEEVQPLVSLHGHIHESRGIVRIGRTVAINSGSEYNSGRIHGCLVEMSADAVLTSQLVTG
jgi:uncharacterized protein